MTLTKISAILLLLIFILHWFLIKIVSYNRHCRVNGVGLTFDKFQTLYNADPNNWRIRIEREYDEDIEGKIPIYKDKFAITFSSFWNYIRFLGWLKKANKGGVGPGNLQRVENLVEEVRNSVEERARKAQEELESIHEDSMKKHLTLVLNDKAKMLDKGEL